MPNPSVEAPRIRQYVFDFLALSGTLGVLETKFSFIPDGRRLDEVWPSRRAYLSSRSGAIVGSDGVIKLVTDVTPVRERLLDAQLAAAFGQAAQ